MRQFILYFILSAPTRCITFVMRLIKTTNNAGKVKGLGLHEGRGKAEGYGVVTKWL